MTNYNQSYKYLWGIGFQKSALFKGEKIRALKEKLPKEEKNEFLNEMF